MSASGRRVSPKRNRRSRRRGATGGGTHSCNVCKQLVRFGIGCSFCGRIFHEACILSIDKGNDRVCASCFNSKRMCERSLDSHSHAPFSPENKIPFHAYTFRFARDNNLNQQHESGEEYVPPESESESESAEAPKQPTKRKLSLESPASKKSKSTPAPAPPPAAPTPAPAPPTPAQTPAAQTPAPAPPPATQTPVQPPAQNTGTTADAASAVIDANDTVADAASAVRDGHSTGPEEPDDGIRLHPHVIKHPTVLQLERNKAYTQMARMSVMTRRDHNKAEQFKEMRSVVRSAAKKARKAYADAAKAQPETPHVAEFLQVITSGTFIR